MPRPRYITDIDVINDEKLKLGILFDNDFERVNLLYLERIVREYDYIRLADEKDMVGKLGLQKLFYLTFKFFNPVIDGIDATRYNAARMVLKRKTGTYGKCPFTSKDFEFLGLFVNPTLIR